MAYSLKWQQDPGWDLTKVTCVSPPHNTDTETNPQWAQQVSTLQRQEEHAIPLATNMCLLCLLLLPLLKGKN